MARDDRISRIGESREAWRERKENNRRLAYERKIVRKILTTLGVPRVQLKIDAPDNPAEQDWYLTLAWMEFRYPNVPMHTTTADVWNISAWDFFRVRTRKNSFWPKWNELKEEFGNSDRPIACFFPLPQASGLGNAVLHNLDLPYIADEDPQELLRMERVTTSLEHISLELFPSFINRLGLVWNPQ